MTPRAGRGILAAMARRRRIRGKKLLIVAAGIAGAAALGCGGGDEVGNPFPPPEDSGAFMDGPVANLVAPPPDSGFDGAVDAGDDDAAPGDAGEHDGSPGDGGVAG